MTARTIWRWLGIAAQLYVLFTLIFFTFNVGTILIIRGPEPLTPPVLGYIFARDAIMSLGLAAIGCFFVAYFTRALRQRLPRP